MKQKLSEFLHDFRTLAAPYWSSEERWGARGLGALVVALNLAAVGLTVAFNSWYRVFYDALQNYDADAFWRQIAIFSGLATLWVLVNVYSTYFQQMLQIRWRRWLNSLEPVTSGTWAVY